MFECRIGGAPFEALLRNAPQGEGEQISDLILRCPPQAGLEGWAA